MFLVINFLDKCGRFSFDIFPIRKKISYFDSKQLIQIQINTISNNYKFKKVE